MTTMTETNPTDDKVREILDRTYDALPESIRGIWSCNEGGGDHWADAMDDAFSLCDAAHYMGWETDPSYHASPMGVGGAEDHWPTSEYVEAKKSGEITPADSLAGQKVLCVVLHALDLLGLSY